MLALTVFPFLSGAYFCRHVCRLELQDGAVCVSNAYPFEGWEPIEVIGVDTSSVNPDASSDIFVYRQVKEEDDRGDGAGVD